MYFRKRRDIFYNSNFHKNQWRRNSAKLNEFSERNTKVLREELDSGNFERKNKGKGLKEECPFYLMGPWLQTSEKVGESIKDYGSSGRSSATIASGSDAGWGYGPLNTHTLSNEYDSERKSGSVFSLFSKDSRKFSDSNFQVKGGFDSTKKKDEKKKIKCRSWLGFFENNGITKLNSSSSLEVKTSCTCCTGSRSNYTDVSSRLSITSSKTLFNEENNKRIEKLVNTSEDDQSCCRSRARLFIKSKPHSQVCYDICDWKYVPCKRILSKQTDSSNSENKQLYSYVHKMSNTIKLEKANRDRLPKSILRSKYSRSRRKKTKTSSTEGMHNAMMREKQSDSRLKDPDEISNSILYYRYGKTVKNNYENEKLDDDDCKEIHQQLNADQNDKEIRCKCTKEIKRNLNLNDRSEEFCSNLYPKSSQEEYSNNLKSSLSSVYRIGGGSDELNNSPRTRKKLAKKNRRIKEYTNLSESVSPSEKRSFLSWIRNKSKARHSDINRNEALKDFSKNVAQDRNFSEKLDLKNSITSLPDDDVDRVVEEFLEDMIRNCCEVLNEKTVEFVDAEAQTSFECFYDSDNTEINSENLLWSCDADKSDLESLISTYIGSGLPESLESTSDSSMSYEDGSRTSYSGSGKMD